MACTPERAAGHFNTWVWFVHTHTHTLTHTCSPSYGVFCSYPKPMYVCTYSMWLCICLFQLPLSDCGYMKVLSASGPIQNAFMGSIALGRQLITSLLFWPPLKPPSLRHCPKQPLITVINSHVRCVRDRLLFITSSIVAYSYRGRNSVAHPCIRTCHCLCYGTLRACRALPTEVGLTVTLTPAVKFASCRYIYMISVSCIYLSFDLTLVQSSSAKRSFRK